MCNFKKECSQTARDTQISRQCRKQKVWRCTYFDHPTSSLVQVFAAQSLPALLLQFCSVSLNRWTLLIAFSGVLDGEKTSVLASQQASVISDIVRTVSVSTPISINVVCPIQDIHTTSPDLRSAFVLTQI